MNPPPHARRAGLAATVLCLLSLGSVAHALTPAVNTAASALPQAPAPSTPPQPPAATPAPPTPASPARPSPVAPSHDTAMAIGEQTIGQLENQAQATSNDATLARMAGEAAAIARAANTVAAARAAEITALDRDVRKNRPRGPPRAAALAQRSALQAQLRQAQGISVQADAAFSLVAERRREGFNGRLLNRTTPPLSPGFWTALAAALGPDLTRLTGLAARASAYAQHAEPVRGAGGLALGLLWALVLLLPLRRSLEAAVAARLASSRAPARLAKSGFAVFVAVLNTAAPLLAAIGLRLAAEWGGLLSVPADQLAGAATAAIGWGAAIRAVGRALATDPRAERRMLTLSDTVARRLDRQLLAVALICALGFLLTRLNYVVGASVAATIAANNLLSLAYVSIAGVILMSAARSRSKAMASLADQSAPIWTLVSIALSLAILATVWAVIGGYSALAILISGQIFWLGLIAAVTFLLVRLIDDVFTAMFAEQGLATRSLVVLFGLRRATVAQLGLLAAAGLQLLVLALAVTLAITPFGQDGHLLFRRLQGFDGSLKIGAAKLSLAALASGFAVVVFGLTAVHLVRRWVVRRYLPATGWDTGLQNSVGTGVSYLGVAITLLCALGATGLGLQQIALIASALSVGIGFGLQQIVQNFVSGIIVLIERPVKVGDWVNVGGVEGDIRRIRVRATEIQMFDRTTVIVPNSDLITKQVQNRTTGPSKARIELQVSIASAADAQRAAEAVVGAAQDIPAILKTPPLAVYVDSLASGGGVNFKVYGYVDSPRRMTQARSDLYFAIIKAFGAANLALLGVAGPQNVVLEPGPTLQTLLGKAAAPEGGPGATT
ncbi:MAG TPA: DUF3772 domain-containing protein [Phenylobacterium sp.]|uniref:DUF3772 domain-containing protein n=1 Tax=Phenylobacterium sp. TaxID=1871053 RepID=UPI002D4C2F3C|nr:DUF3772 domain-containing protein [Phenylobacterium sp.]HZZ66943.1 DUF3772 domain-containing protein [Phenylobacterium sp.]